ncbi:hypothetical protein [Mycobacterium sp. URHB0021]
MNSENPDDWHAILLNTDNADDHRVLTELQADPRIEFIDGWAQRDANRRGLTHRLAAAANRAPSGGDAPPWSLEIGDDSLTIHLVTKRRWTWACGQAPSPWVLLHRLSPPYPTSLGELQTRFRALASTAPGESQAGTEALRRSAGIGAQPPPQFLPQWSPDTMIIRFRRQSASQS